MQLTFTGDEIEIVRSLLQSASEQQKIEAKLNSILSGQHSLGQSLHQIEYQQENLLAMAQQAAMTNEEFKGVLKKIDDATTKTAENVTAMGVLGTTIESEVQALVAGMTAQGVSQDLVDQAQATAVKAGALSDAADQLAPVLTRIASEGATNPVPVPVPPPVAPHDTGSQASQPSTTT